MHLTVRLLVTSILALCLPHLLAGQSVEVGVFGEGLFTLHKTGGVGGRVGYNVVPGFGLEAEGAREFHSETYTLNGQRFYDSGYSFLAGPRFRIPLPVIRIFATAKGGFLRLTSHPEDETQPSLAEITSGAAYLGGGTEIGNAVTLRIDAGDLLLFHSSLRHNNLRIAGGISFHF